MSSLSATFSKSKWLAFFAELSAKVSHHNPAIVIEGCELIRRLLLTRVSVAAFLEEGHLLQHICNAFSSLVAPCEHGGGPASREPEAIVALLHTIDLIVNYCLALNADGDEYVSLLVRARALILLRSLWVGGQLPDRRHPVCAHSISLMLSLLSSLELRAPVQPTAVQHGSAAARHLRSLEESAGRSAELLSSMRHEVNLCQVRAQDDPMHSACLQRLESALAASTDDTAGCNMENGQSLLDPLAVARNHTDAFRAINHMWQVLTLSPASLEETPTESELSALRRFVSVAPQTSNDACLFRQLLHWLSNAVKLPLLSEPLKQVLLELATCGTFELLRGADVTDVDDQSADVAKPSTDLSILVFAMSVVSGCEIDKTLMLRWVPRMLLRLVPFVERAATACRSLLVDAPSNVDGSLPDELYLGCALKSARDDYAATASVAMRLLSSVLVTYEGMLVRDALSSVVPLIEAVVPPCLSVVVQNPTMSRGRASPSLVHYIGRCPSSVRAVGLAEAAGVLLDVSLACAAGSAFEAAPVTALLDPIGNVNRAVGTSMLTHLRALPWRLLIAACSSFRAFLTINHDMPSFTIGAMRQIAQPDDDVSDCEQCSHALFVTVALRAALAQGADSPLDLVSQTAAVPRQLLSRIDGMGVADTRTCSFLHLLCAVADVQLASSSSTAALSVQALGGSFAPQVSAVSALAPHGSASVASWVNIVNNHRVSLDTMRRQIAERGRRVVTTADDATARAREEVQRITGALSSAAALFAAACRLFDRFPDVHAAFPQDTIVAFVTMAFEAPQPTVILEALDDCYGVLLPRQRALEQAYNDCVSWAGKLLRVFFKGGASLVFGGVSQTLFDNACRAVETDDTSPAAKASVAAGIFAMSQLKAHADLQQSVASAAAEVFLAIRCAGNEPTTLALRADLCFSHKEANHAAFECGWFTQQAASLAHSVGSLPNDIDRDDPVVAQVSERLSFVVSALGCSSCYPITRRDANSVAASMLRISKVAVTANMFLESCRRLSCSSEGQHVLLSEAANASAKAVDSRSPFSRLVAMTFGAATSAQRTSTGMDAVAACCARGGDDFANPLLKMRVLEVLEQELANSSSRGVAPPTGVLRLIASLSCCEGLHIHLGRRPELVTLLIDAAAEDTSQGTLALLTLRNLSFCPALKNQLCLDTRVLQLLKRALFMLPPPPEASVQRGRHKRRHPTGDATSSSSSSVERFRRQELAGTAVWSLVHQNQRAKSYLRGALREEPSVNIEDLAEQVAAVEHLTLLPEYRPAMDRVLEGLGACGLAPTVAATAA